MKDGKDVYNGKAEGVYDPDTFAGVMTAVGAQRVDTRKRWEDLLEHIYFVKGVAVRIKADYRHTNAVATVTLFGDEKQVGEVEKAIKAEEAKCAKAIVQAQQETSRTRIPYIPPLEDVDHDAEYHREMGHKPY